MGLDRTRGGALNLPRLEPSKTQTLRGAPVTGRQRGVPRFPAVFFFIVLFVLTSRGLLELLAGKTAAYGAQAGVVVLFTSTLLFRGRPCSTKRLAICLLLLWLLVIAALLSVLATANGSGAQGAAIYAAVMVFFGVLLMIFSGLDFAFTPGRGAGTAVALVALGMILVALMQQFGSLTLFPGTDLGTFRTEARPSAMTGSFLHYPIALSLLSFLLFGMYAISGRRVLLLSGLAGFLAVVVSYSRSGMVIVVVGLAVALLAAQRVQVYVRLLVGLPLVAVAALLAAPTGSYVDRFVSIFQSAGAGNTSRITKWETLLDLWMQSPLLIGSHAGEYTNITSNLGSADTAPPESGVLEVLVSLGLLGLVAYYGLMVLAVNATPSDAVWFRAGMIAAIVQSFVYQSIEVLPFMGIYAMTPLLAKAMHPKTMLEAEH